MSTTRIPLTRLSRLMQQCDATLADWPASAHQAAWTTDCRCPDCAARGSSIIGDDAGRFVRCMVCGSSVQCTAPHL